MRWHDRPLLLEEGVGAVVAGVGAFLPGYVLVAPSQHVAALSGIPEPSRDAFVRFLLGFVDDMESGLGEVSVWEHGGSSTDARSSACVFHAHLHVMPGRFNPPRDIPASGIEYRDGLAEFLHDSRRWLDRPYLLFGQPGGPCWVATDLGVSQYFRRHIARVLDLDEEWDYAAAPRYDVVRSTVDLVQRLLREQ